SGFGRHHRGAPLFNSGQPPERFCATMLVALNAIPRSPGRTEGVPSMKILRASAVAVSVLGLSLSSPALKASDKDKTPAQITVAFGAGLNTAQPGNTPNHHIIPQEFRVRITKAKKLDGTVVFVPATVNFIVSGFHWPWVYNAGVTLDEVKAHIPAAGTFVNYDV